MYFQTLPGRSNGRFTRLALLSTHLYAIILPCTVTVRIRVRTVLSTCALAYRIKPLTCGDPSGEAAKTKDNLTTGVAR